MSSDRPSTPAPWFDRKGVLAQIGGDENLLREIAKVFLIDGPNLRQRLGQALTDNDLSALHATAHCAKSAVGNFGADAAVRAAMALEDATKTGEHTQLVALTDALCATLIEVEDALRPEANR